MLKGTLRLISRKHCIKYLSTNALPKTQNELSEKVADKEARLNEALQSPDYFSVHNLFTVKDLFDAKVHYGHKDISVTRNMKPFIFGSRLGHTIFDLDITAYHLREALNFTAHIAFRSGIILFISKNPRMTLLVENTAKDCNEYAVTREWTLGAFTDGENIIPFMRLPDLCIFLNTLQENGRQHLAVVEAAKMCIPTIGIVDSNCNPNLITYPIPGNDDSLSCFQLYCELFKQAILRGKNERNKYLMENKKAELTKNKSDKSASENAEAVQKNKENIASTYGNLETKTVEKNNEFKEQ